MKTRTQRKPERTYPKGKRNTFVLPDERYLQLQRMANGERRSVSQQASLILEERLKELEETVA